MMTTPNWPPRDWRKLLAMFLLSGGGMALTVFAWGLVEPIAARSKDDPWALAYGLYGLLFLIGIVLISLGWVIGKTSVSGSVGAASFEVSGGEAEAAQATADAAQEKAEEFK